MKKIVAYVSLVIILIVSTSCSKDEVNTDGSIEGTWKLTSFKLSTPVDLNNDGVSTTTFLPGCLNGSNLKFTDASNGSIFFSSTVTYNTIKENGKLFIMTACSTDSELIPTPITYSRNGEIILITSNSEDYILTIDGNTISLMIPDGFKASDADTFETSISEDITYIFTKQ